eukprot:COSAG06_NODE_104_length_23856_cov_6.259629_8_plen_121_part_00
MLLRDDFPTAALNSACLVRAAFSTYKRLWRIVDVGTEYCPGPPVCNPAARGEISDIHLENIEVHGHDMGLIYSQFTGNSTAHGVHGVSIREFVIDGTAATTLANLNATTDEFVSGVTVQA